MGNRYNLINYSYSIPLCYVLQVAARTFNTSYLSDGLASSSSVLVVRLSSPKMPSRLVVKCSSYIGEMYEASVVARVRVERPTKPVLGEPLLSDCERVVVGGRDIIVINSVLWIVVGGRDYQG